MGLAWEIFVSSWDSKASATQRDSKVPHLTLRSLDVEPLSGVKEPRGTLQNGSSPICKVHLLL